MVTTAFILVIVWGVLSAGQLFNDKLTPGIKLFCLICGIAFLSFGVTGLVLR